MVLKWECPSPERIYFCSATDLGHLRLTQGSGLAQRSQAQLTCLATSPMLSVLIKAIVGVSPQDNPASVPLTTPSRGPGLLCCGGEGGWKGIERMSLETLLLLTYSAVQQQVSFGLDIVVLHHKGLSKHLDFPNASSRSEIYKVFT